MKFKGSSTLVSYVDDKLEFTVDIIEEVDGGLVSDTKNGRITIKKSCPSTTEKGLKICKNYIITITPEGSKDFKNTVYVTKMSLEKGLELITYTLSGKNIGFTLELTLPKTFETDFKLNDAYYIHWEETN